MENKTISYLNSKIWYRFIKVIYLLILFISIVGYSTAIFISYSQEYDNTKSYIKCANGKNFILSQNEIDLHSDFMGSSDREKSKSLCFDGLNSIEKTDSDHIFRLKTISETENSGKYELVSIYINRNWIVTIEFILLSIIGNLFIFEAIRRGFYYVVLGSIRPKK